MTMQLKTFFAQDRSGNVIPNATVRVFLANTETLASIFDVAGASKSNPFNTGETGQVQFRVANGEYDVRIVTGEGEYTQRVESFDFDEAEIETDSGTQTVPEAVDFRVIRGQVGDESVTTGTGTQTVAQALNRRGVKFTALRAPEEGEFDPEDYLETATKVTEGLDCYTLGHYEKGDGGGNDYEIVAAGTGTDDGGSFIDLAGSGLQAKGLFVADYVPIETFGAIADSETDQSNIFDAFTDYLRQTGKKGTLPKGTLRVSRSIDVSGVYMEGCRHGFRGRLGTIIEGVSDGVLDRPAIILEQKSTSGIALTYGVKGVQVRNAELALKMTYALWCLFEDFHVEEVTNGIECGDPNILGTLKNVFRLCHIRADDTAVAVLGRDFSNSNCFQDCFLEGGNRAVYIDAGGTRAANNIFLNTQVAGDNLGFVLERTVSTTLDNCYMETVGPVIKIQGFSSSIQVKNPVIGTVRTINPSNAPYFIWHEGGGGASISVEGGWLTIGSEDQDNLEFIHSDPETLSLIFYTRPHITNLSQGFEWFGSGLPRAGWQGLFNGRYTPVWTAATTNPTLGNGTIEGEWAIHGDMCTVDGRLTLGSTTDKGAGTWFFSLPFASSGLGIQRSGIAEFQFIGVGRSAAVARINTGSSNVYFVGYDNSVFVNPTVPRSWAEGDTIRFTITYRMPPA